MVLGCPRKRSLKRGGVEVCFESVLKYKVFSLVRKFTSKYLIRSVHDHMEALIERAVTNVQTNNLQVLNLNGQKLTNEFPDNLNKGHLFQRIPGVPRPVCAHSSLQVRRVDLGLNPLSKIPTQILRMAITHLSLIGCQFTAVPREISMLARTLVQLDFSGNKIVKLEHLVRDDSEDFL